MGISTSSDGTGITTVTIDYAPVNAIPSKGWFELADAILDAGKDLNTHVVILRAEGRGFNAGVDIKEMQATEGFDALVAANRGCAAAFAAVYGLCCTRRRGRQRILCRRRYRTRRQRGRDRRFRRRDLLPPPRSTAAHSALPHTSRGWCHST